MCTNKCLEEAGRVSENNTHLRRSNSSRVSGLADKFAHLHLHESALIENHLARAHTHTHTRCSASPLAHTAHTMLPLQTCFWMYSQSQAALTMARYREILSKHSKHGCRAGRGWAPSGEADARYECARCDCVRWQLRKMKMSMSLCMCVHRRASARVCSPLSS